MFLNSFISSRIKMTKTCSRGSLCGVMANMLECDFVVSEFELQSCYYVHFRTNNLGKGINSLLHTAMVDIVSLLSFHKDSNGIK